MSKSNESDHGISEWRSEMVMCLESYINFKMQKENVAGKSL